MSKMAGINDWKKVGTSGFIFFVLGILFVNLCGMCTKNSKYSYVEKKNIKKTSCVNDLNKESYTLTFKNNMYEIVPSDMVSKEEYKKIFEKYKISPMFDAKMLGDVVSESKQSTLYSIKYTDTYDILIVKDANGEYVWAINKDSI